jgi:hypothetical protein
LAVSKTSEPVENFGEHRAGVVRGDLFARSYAGSSRRPPRAGKHPRTDALAEANPLAAAQWKVSRGDLRRKIERRPRRQRKSFNSIVEALAF